MKRSLKRDCLRHLRDTFGLEGYRPGQKAAVETLLSGRDLMCILPTGAGKSLCWQLPALVHEGLTVVVSPLIALMRDQVQHLQRAGVAAVSIDSLMSKEERSQAMTDIRRGEIRIVFVSPERLEQRQFRQLCCDAAPWLVVVDEAHCIVQWGEEFRPAYDHIGEFLQMLPKRPVLCAMTATADAGMQREIIRSLSIHRVRKVQLPHIRENLRYEVRTTLNVPGEILRMCLQTPCKTLVFCATRSGAEWLAELLRKNGVSAAFYHAGLERQQRLDIQEAFRTGRVEVLCATSAFGMGVDIPDIRRVIHDHLAGDLIDYAQQSGRAGRDGLDAACVLLFEPNDFLIRARRPRSVTGGMGWHLLRKQQYLQSYWRKLQKLLRVMLRSDCIPSQMAASLGRRIPPCGKCSACRQGAMLKSIPDFRHMREWQIRLWFLQWQRDEMARRQRCAPGSILSDRAMMTAARLLVLPDGGSELPEMERLLAHFRGERMYISGEGGTD